MITSSGFLVKMGASWDQESPQSPVEYTLNFHDLECGVELNSLLGKQLRLVFNGQMQCIHCHRSIKKSYAQGHCFSCFRRLAKCDLCFLKPSLCHYDRGTCRQPQWGDDYCNQSHIVYLANSSGPKVGITKASNTPTRWLDQGAVQAMPLFEVPSRYHSGLLEEIFKEDISDTTNWRKMLQQSAETVDLPALAAELQEGAHQPLEDFIMEFGEESLQEIENPTLYRFHYPIERYPEKIKSLSADKNPQLQGQLWGIKGQYLIFDTGVFNIRKHSGYHLQLQILESSENIQRPQK